MVKLRLIQGGASQKSESSKRLAPARFKLGEVVHHRLYNYRGVIVGVDPCFQGSQEWYETVARSRPPKNRPWYEVLVDEASHSTYVAERHLETDTVLRPITHPRVHHFFSHFRNGRYFLN